MLTIVEAEQDLHLLCSEAQFKNSDFSTVQKLSTQIKTRYGTPIDTNQVGNVNMPSTLLDETARSFCQKTIPTLQFSQSKRLVMETVCSTPRAEVFLEMKERHQS